jgi:hypothetical protein
MNNFVIYLVLVSFVLILSIINAIYLIIYNKNTIIKFLSILLFFMIIYLSTFREIFLPFLGSSAYPPPLIPSEMHPPNTNYSLNYNFDYPNGSKIIYWASEDKAKTENEIYNNPHDAYGNYKNSGIAIINNNKAVLHINYPDKYKIPSGNILNRHIHYRVATPNNPILSEVKTIYI